MGGGQGTRVSREEMVPTVEDVSRSEENFSPVARGSRNWASSLIRSASYYLQLPFRYFQVRVERDSVVAWRCPRKG